MPTARWSVLLAVATVAAAASACAGTAPSSRGPDAAAARVTSNLLRADYAGSRACAGCHADVYRAWWDSPMHRMTRLPAELDATRQKPFDASTFRFKDDSARLEERGGSRFMRVSSKVFGDHLYRVTKVIGGRYREDYAGLEVPSEDPGAPVMGDPGAELILPVSYLVRSGGFRLKGYSVMVGERPGMAAGNVWNQACVYCHNTSPYFSTLLGPLAGPKPPSYQGVVVDRILPRDRRTKVEVTDPEALAGAIADEIRFFADTPQDPSPPNQELARQAIGATRSKLGERHLVEVGIGCESCHGGSREHVRDPARRPSFEIESRFLRVRRIDGTASTRAEAINRTCARCHQVLFTRYPFTWEGSLRDEAQGGSNITSGEGRDFLLGGCSRAMSCVDCHDPHAEDKPARLAELATRAGNAACARCHAKLATDTGLRAHAHHDPNGAAGVCIACHMPKKNMGLGYDLTRYHRIGSPTDSARVLGDRPLECAICHADRSAERLVSDMERLWGKVYDRGPLRALYGDLDAPVLEKTLERGKAHEKVVAMDALARARAPAALPFIAAELTNDIPLVRYFARRALETATGAPCTIDLERGRDDIHRDGAAWLAEHPTPPAPRRAEPTAGR